MLYRFFIFIVAALVAESCAVESVPENNQNSETLKLVSGPMPGHSAMREAKVWLQLNNAAEVYLKYRERDNENAHFIQSRPVTTRYANGFTATLTADSLEPGRNYEYKVMIDGKEADTPPLYFQSQKLWQHREEPPDWSFATGSCAYINEKAYDRPGEPYGRNYRIFEAIRETNPEMFLWLGDNVYLREADYDSRSGFIKRYSHVRALPELQKMLSAMHHYAIWDDHDYGPNDADKSYVFKNTSLDIFRAFWPNPSFGFQDEKAAATTFHWNDCLFVLADNRFFRTSNFRSTGSRDYLGGKQLEWIIDVLKSSNASFKFVAVGGQVLNTAKVYENYANYPEERKKLLQRITDEQIKNVIFLTGDRHKTELSEYDAGDFKIRDLTCSPLTSKAYNSVNENNRLRVEGTHVAEQNFAKISLSGTRAERQLHMQIFNAKGEQEWKRLILRE